MGSSFAISIALLLLVQVSAQADETSKTVLPEDLAGELGFKVRRGSRQLEFTDSKSLAKTILKWTASGDLSAVEDFDSKGKLRSRWKSRQGTGTAVSENFSSGYLRVETQIDDEEDLWRQSIYLSAGSRKPAKTRYVSSRAWTQEQLENDASGCELRGAPEATENLKLILAALGQTPRNATNDVEIRNQLIVQSECSDYPAQGGSSGIKQLADDLSLGLIQGLKCISEVSHEPGLADLRSKAAQILSLFEPGKDKRKFRISCATPGSLVSLGDKTELFESGAAAQACLRTNPAHPAIIISPTESDFSSPRKAGGTFFHELLHLVDYHHEDGIDFPYLAQYCCFEGQGSERAPVTQRACALLRKSGTLDWRSSEYLLELGALHEQNRAHPSLTYEAAWNSVASQTSNPRADGLFDFALDYRPSSNEPENTLPIVNALLAYSSMDLQSRGAVAPLIDEKILKPYFDAAKVDPSARQAKKNFLSLVGRMLGLMLKNDATTFQVLLSDAGIRAQIDNGCRAVSATERKRIQATIGMVNESFHSFRQGLSQSVIQSWTGLCEN